MVVVVIVGMDTPSGFAHLGPPFGFIVAVMAYQKTTMIMVGADLSPPQLQVQGKAERRWGEFHREVVRVHVCTYVHVYVCTNGDESMHICMYANHMHVYT